MLHVDPMVQVVLVPVVILLVRVFSLRKRLSTLKIDPGQAE